MELLYGRQYRELYLRHWWWRAREEALVRVLRRHLNSQGQLRILDVGCGDGLFFDRLAEFGNVEGVEPDGRLVNPASSHSARINIVPFDKNFRPEKHYGLLLMLDVLEHLDDPSQALECAYSLLEEWGALLLTVPAFQILWTNHDVINHHRIRYRRHTLFPLLRNAGFSISEALYWYQWAVPVKLAVRMVERILPSQPSLPRIPPEWLNRLLYQVSRIEQDTLGASGIPFGSTLMVYCTRAENTGDSTVNRLDGPH